MQFVTGEACLTIERRQLPDRSRLDSGDFANHQTSLNLTQAHVDADDRVRLVVAATDPGVPNWIDTEGRPFGLVFWRFMLPEGPIEGETDS